MDQFGRRALLAGGAAVVVGIAGAPKPALAVLPAAALGALETVVIVADPNEFSGIDPAGASDSSAGLQACVDACPDGGTVVVPTGLYRVGSPIAPKNSKSITLSGYGATMLATSAHAVFSLRGEQMPIIGVQSLREQSRAFPEGRSAICTELTLSAPSDWSAGDVVKIVSDDAIEGGRSSQSRRGEFAVVSAVDGLKVSLGHRVRESYVTNVRAARISQQTIAIRGFQFRAADERMPLQAESFISLSRLSAPRISDVRVTRSGGPCVRLSSCFGYLVEQMDVAIARDDPSNNALGYGVFDNSSSYGRIEGGVFRHVRHAYTDDTPPTVANADSLDGYGRTYGTVLTGVHAIATTSAAFSTHHSSEAVTFINCVVTGSGDSAFALRGKGHRVVSCSATHGKNGVFIFTESGGGESWGHRITDFSAASMSNAAVHSEVRPIGHPFARTRDDRVTATVEGLSAVACLRLVYSVNSTLAISDAHYVAPNGMAGELLEGFYLRNSSVNLRGIVLDYTQNRAGLPRPVITGGGSGFTPGTQITEIDGLTVRITPEIASRAYFLFGGTDNRIYARGVVLTAAFPRTPGESHADKSWQWEVDARPGEARSGISSAYFAMKATAVAAQIGEVLKSSDPLITVQVDTENKNLTVSSLPPGRRVGQRLAFFQASGGQLTFKNGASAGMLLKTGDRVLWRGRTLELTWDGAYWYEVVRL